MFTLWVRRKEVWKRGGEAGKLGGHGKGREKRSGVNIGVVGSVMLRDNREKSDTRERRMIV